MMFVFMVAANATIDDPIITIIVPTGVDLRPSCMLNANLPEALVVDLRPSCMLTEKSLSDVEATNNFIQAQKWSLELLAINPDNTAKLNSKDLNVVIDANGTEVTLPPGLSVVLFDGTK